MVQHLLLMAGAAPLILLGAPAVLFLHSLPQSVLQSIAKFFSKQWVRSLGRALTNPAFCLFAPSLTLIAWHIPALFELAMRSPGLHVVQQASFFVTGLLLWWPVIQPWPSVAQGPRWFVPLYLFFATLPCDALSAFLTFCDRAIYPSYQNRTLPFGLSALSDQQLAGSFMWICVTFIYLLPAVAVTMQILAPSHRHRTNLDEQRTARLGASGLGVA
jgi:cytochrome c oxidase assembly factor CtaG